MKMPLKLESFLRSLTPAEADELWLYFDGCTNEGVIDILSGIALGDPVIAARENKSDRLTK